MNDFVKAQGEIGLAVRLKRISDMMMHGARQLYKSLNLDIEPNWYLMFKILNQYEKLSVTEIADKLHFAHPSVVNIVKKMKDRGYLETTIDAFDSRKQMITLSQKSKDVLPELEKIWGACGRGIQSVFEPDDQFFEKLDEIEAFYREADFMQRTLKEMGNG